MNNSFSSQLIIVLLQKVKSVRVFVIANRGSHKYTKYSNTSEYRWFVNLILLIYLNLFLTNLSIKMPGRPIWQVRAACSLWNLVYCSVYCFFSQSWLSFGYEYFEKCYEINVIPVNPIRIECYGLLALKSISQFSSYLN